jgi:hypothetical protein
MIVSVVIKINTLISRRRLVLVAQQIAVVAQEIKSVEVAQIIGF